MTAGYSGTPLARKLGIKPGAVVGTFGAPPEFADLLAPLPDGATLARDATDLCDVLVVFAVTHGDLEERFATAIELLPATGGLWVGWPKRSSGVTTELDFDAVQRHGLDRGLVDNKVCAISDVWSGLRFVVRVADRPAWPR